MSYDVCSAWSYDDGAAFSPPRLLCNGYFARIAFVGQSVYLVWAATAKNGLLFSRSTDGGQTFSNPVYIRNSAVACWEPFMAADSSGNIYIVWRENFSLVDSLSDPVMFTLSSNYGQSFAPAKSIMDPQTKTWVDDFTLNEIGDLFLTFWTGDHVYEDIQWYLKVSTDGAGHFSAPMKIRGLPSTIGIMKVASKSPGQLSIAFSAKSGTTSDVYYCTARVSDP